MKKIMKGLVVAALFAGLSGCMFMPPGGHNGGHDGGGPANQMQPAGR